MSLEDILESPHKIMKLSFPPVMLNLMEEAAKPEPDFAVLGKIISMDPALSTTILNLVNSPFYGLSQEISDLKRAAIVLGTRELLNLAVTVTFQKHICSNLTIDGYDIYEDWLITVWGAIAANLIASRICPDHADRVYLCCLLKDIGLFFLGCNAPEELPGLDRMKNLTFLYSGQIEEEEKVWGMNHGDLSQTLLNHWKVKALDCPAIKKHHDILNLDSHDPQTKAVILATRWAEMEIGGAAAPFNVLQFESLLQNSLNMCEEDLEGFRDVCRTKFKSMLATLGMSENKSETPYYEHSIKNLQASYFLSLELLTAEGGLDTISRIISRHLKLNWDISNWELALKSPHSKEFSLYRSEGDAGVSRLGSGLREEEIKWQSDTFRREIFSHRIKLGELRLERSEISENDIEDLNLYLRFVGQSYEHYSAKQFLLEDRAQTLESLPLAIATLDNKGRLKDMNDQMSRMLGGAGASGESDFKKLVEMGINSSLGSRWDVFLNSENKKAFSKIQCGRLRTGGAPKDSCLYLSAHKNMKNSDSGVTVIMEDIREVSEAQVQSLKERDFLEGLLDSMKDIVFTVDKRGNIGYASSRFSKIFLGRNLFDIASPSETFTGRWGPEVLSHGKNIIEVTLSRTESSGLPFELVISSLGEEGGDRFLIVARDLTPIRRLEDKLKKQAVFDGLTELFNHSQFNSLLHREIARSDRTGRAFGLMFFDLDGFKNVNDTEGHLAGDKILRSVGRILKEELRAGMDFPCRYGGDEFAAIVTEVRAEGLQKIAERIRLRAEKEFSGRVTVSGGLAVLRPGEKASDVLKRADTAAYKAKGKGGNKFEWS
ncbi:sensor domain-containing diguanylate cyclase [Maridesulfovibrio bastinii]|uniref:sensor domain-containing diguanylate cyclase n=1 Tax=Maridesulfovibrio bastinii TaxID=47157 RepID=UPI0004112C8B|nr:GGDEF domain-containing protein [Maridesulfovibrio bastinii]